MKILLLNHGPLEVVPALRNLSSLLQERGHCVTVVAYTDKPRSRSVTADNGVREFLIYRGADRVSPRPLRAAVRFCRFGWGARKIIAEFNPAAVVAFHYDSLALAHFFSRRRRRIVYYALEYTPRPVAPDFWTGWGFLKLIEPWLVHRADLIVSVEQHRATLQANEWQSTHPLVVPNAPRADAAIRQVAQARLASTPGGRPVRLVYAGAVYSNTMISELVGAVYQLRGKATLDIYGAVNPVYEAELAALLDQQQPQCASVRYCGSVSYRDLPGVLVGYDVGVVLYRPQGVNYELAAPGKLLEYMKAGLAVVATPQPFLRAIVEGTGSGWLVDCEDPAGLETTLMSVVADRTEIAERGARGLQAFSDGLSYDVGAEVFVRQLEQLSPSPLHHRTGRTPGTAGNEERTDCGARSVH